LNALGYKWGCRVRDGYVCPQEALFRLMLGAERMRSFREPWTQEEVQDCLRSAIIRGLAPNHVEDKEIAIFTLTNTAGDLLIGGKRGADRARCRRLIESLLKRPG
jgi:hypothetical protein